MSDPNRPVVTAFGDPTLAGQLAGKVFTGEVMVCVCCGKLEVSSKDKSTQWRAVSADFGRGLETFYACPAEFPPDGASAAQYEAAYRRVVREICTLRGPRGFAA